MGKSTDWPTYSVGIGIVILGGALGSWYRFYAPLVSLYGGGLSDALGCIIQTSGWCSVASGLAKVAGQAAYSPTWFWIGVAFIGLGVTFKRKASGSSPS